MKGDFNATTYHKDVHPMNITNLPPHFKAIKAIKLQQEFVSKGHNTPLMDICAKFGITRLYANNESMGIVNSKDHISLFKKTTDVILQRGPIRMNNVRLDSEYISQKFNCALQTVFCPKNGIKMKIIVGVENVRTNKGLTEIRSIYFLAGKAGENIEALLNERPCNKNQKAHHNNVTPTPVAMSNFKRGAQNLCPWTRVQYIKAYWDAHPEFRKEYRWVVKEYESRRLLEEANKKAIDGGPGEKADNIV
jgi:hypothetical protein